MANKRIGLILLALLVMLSVLPLPAFAEQSADIPHYVVSVYNERNGLPTGEANAVLQTMDGYIWIGSYGGLIRYDGSTFYNYSTEELLPTFSVRALFEDSQGKLWIGTNDAGAFYLEGGALYAVENDDPGSYLCVRGFAEGEDGVIYIASNSGMAEIREGKLIAYEGDYISGGTVYAVGVDNLGRVWAALSAGMCAVVQDGQALRVYATDELFKEAGLEICSTASDRIGRIYLGTSGSTMARLTFPSDSLEPKDLSIEYIDTPHVITHNSILPTADGWMIICGQVGACAISPEDGDHPITAEEGASTVNSGCVDYEGNVWLATSDSGVLKCTQGSFSSPNKQAGLEGVALSAVARQQGSTYLGTNNGLMVYDPDWQPVDNELTQLFEGARIRSLMADSRGRVWVASYANQCSVVCYDPADDSMQVFTVDNGLPNTNARSLLELSDGSVVVGTQDGVSVIRDGQIAQNYTADDGLASGSILCLIEGHDGSILLGHDGGGVYQIKDGVVTNHSTDEGLNDGVVLRMIRDQGAPGYFVSAGSSLYYWTGSNFRKLTVRKGAGSIFDFFMQDDMLWIIQNSGILAFDRELLLAGENPLPRTFSFAQGLTGSIDANTWHYREEDGSYYLATRNGINVFTFVPTASTMPKGVISSMQIGNDFHRRPESMEIGSDVNRVTINFAVLSFTENDNVGYSYILEGFDEAETVVSGEKHGSISYTNLPGGDYAFHFRVFPLEHPEFINDYSLSITKEPTLWERRPVQVGAVILLVLLVVLMMVIIYRIKIHHIQKRQKTYRTIISQLLHTFARTIDARDVTASGHSLRVAQCARELARRMGKSAEEQENIYCVALLHDIGKIETSDEILAAPTNLSPEERAVLQGVTDGALYHQKRYDGQGHIDQQSGDDIPLVARIIAVAEAYDTLSRDGSNRKALSPDGIAAELRRGEGTQFDPAIVPHMLAMIAEGSVPNKEK